MNLYKQQQGLEAIFASIDALRAARELEEAEVLSASWEGLMAGDYVFLSPAAHIKNGGLLLTNELGTLQLKQVLIIEISGDRALVKNSEPYGESLEWLNREDLGAKADLELINTLQSIAAKYWEEI
jgi:hypothetical protein